MKLKNLLLCALAMLPATEALADADFITHRYDSFKACRLTDKSIVFVGNSITNMGCWYEQFGCSPNVVNRGNSGACSYEALANLETLLIDSPDKIFVMIGTNDIGSQTGTPESIARNGRAFIERAKHVSPATKVHIVSTFPSTNGYRTLENHQEINRQLKAVCEATGTPFIDLWDTMMDLGIINGSLSSDNLHITAPGYHAWSVAVLPYMGDGYTVTLPATTESPTSSFGVANGNGMRPNMLASLPMDSDDILIVGGEMINGGEWHELLQNPGIKARGATYGYGDYTIDQWKTTVSMIFDQNRSIKEEPARILLYTGTQELYTTTTGTDVIADNFRQLVELIKTKAPGAAISLLAQLPMTEAAKNARVKQFNARLQEIATETGAEYIDIFTPMANADGTPDPACITTTLNRPYVSGQGYVRLANVLAPMIDGSTPVMSEAEYTVRRDLIDARNRLGSIADRYYTVNAGTTTGTIAEECLPALAAIRDRAYAELADRSQTADRLNAVADELTTQYDEAIIYNEPIDGKYYEFIAKRDNRRVYMSDETTLLSAAPGAVSTAYTTAQWQLVKRADGDWDIKNRKFGHYISPDGANDSALPVSTTAPAAGWKFTTIGTTGNYIITSGTTQLNATGSPQSYRIYNWGYNTAQFPADFNTTDPGCVFTVNEIPDDITLIDPDRIYSTPKGSTDTEVIYYTFCTPARNSKFMTDSDDGMMNGKDDPTSDYARWKLIEREGQTGVFDITNKQTGRYITPAIAASSQFRSSDERPSDGWTFTPAATAGTYIIHCGSVQLHQANAGMAFRIINWGGGTNTTDDGCKFKLEGIEWIDNDPNVSLDHVAAPSAPSGTYNLHGQKVGGQPGRGLYIIDGVKTVIR